MTESVYRVTEVIGTSVQSWEDAAKNAVEEASKAPPADDLSVATWALPAPASGRGERSVVGPATALQHPSSRAGE